MRVGVSLLTLSPGDMGGSETYARELLRALSRNGRHDYAVLVPARAKDAAEGLPAIEIKDPPVGKRGPLRILTTALQARRTKGIGGIGGQLSGFDAMHYPLTVPTPRVKAPTIVTLHDVQHRDLPEFFGPGRRSFRRLAYDRAARSAAAVIVTSEFVRERARDVLDLDPGRVHVVPLAIDRTVFRPGSEEREPIVLYPARGWPHKNHARLFKAFASLRETRPQLRLVLTGGGLDRLEPLPEGVENLGEVPASQLASLYRRAACLVYPSLYEGFGIPPLEAMACGCPVAASTAGAIPEVCGNAAVFFDPTDVEAMAAAMLEADSRRDELTALGRERAAIFTWDETARLHEEVYDVAVSAGPVGSSTTA
jgi:glycosyltransferase involved in cell wall biosynthesis